MKILCKLEGGRRASSLSWLRWLLVVCAVVWSSVAQAQTVASIVGGAEDANGQAVTGIKVRISGDSLLGGEQEQLTATDGRVRFVDLLPGVYRVEASADGFQTVKIDDVRLSPGETSDLTFFMEVRTTEDVIVVTREAPALDFRKTSLGGSLSKELMRALPQARTRFQTATRFFPGVDISGNAGYPQINGGSNNSNAFLIDGANTTDPTLHGFSTNLNYGAVCDIEVQTGGFSPEFGDFTGGVVNVVTCSGSNEHKGEVSARYLGSALSLEGPTPQGELVGYGTSLNLGGPIVRDRLWYFASLDYGMRETLRAGLVGKGRLPATNSWLYSLLKITAAPSSSDRVTVLFQKDPESFSNQEQSPYILPEAERWQDQGGYLANIRWDGNYGDVGLKTSLSRRKYGVFSYPGVRSTGSGFLLGLLPPFVNQSQFGIATGCFTGNGESFGQPSCSSDIQEDGEFGNGAIIDLNSGEMSQSFYDDIEIIRTRNNLSSVLSLYQPDLFLGDHEIRVGFDFVDSHDESLSRIPGGAIQYFLDGDGDGIADPYVASVVSSADNALQTNVSASTFSLFALDNWDLFQRVRLQPGVRIDRATYRDSKDEPVLDFLTLSPRFSFSADLLGDGTTRVHGGAGLLIETGNLLIASLTSDSLETTRAYYNSETGRYEIKPDDQLVQGGANSTVIGGRVKPMETTEYQIGLGHALSKDNVVDISWMNRTVPWTWEDRESNLLYSRDGSAVEGSTDGSSRSVMELSSWGGTARNYTGFTLSHDLRVQKQWLLSNSYTLAWLEGSSSDLIGPAFGNPAEASFLRGPLAGDHRHTLKLQGAYFASNGVTVGAEYQFLSGSPYSKTYRAPGTATDLLAAPRGVDPGEKLNDPSDDIELRLPDLTQLNLRITYDLAKVIGQKLEVAFDVENALNLRTVTAVEQREGATFGHPLTYQKPLSGQVVVTYSY